MRRSCYPEAKFCAAALAALMAVALAGCGKGLEVEAVTPRVGVIRGYFGEPAQTRLPKTWPITMPVAGRIGRIDLEPGDRVTSGQTLAAYDREPFVKAVEEARAAVAEWRAEIAVKRDNRLEMLALTEAKQSVKAAKESLKALEAEIEAEKKRANRATKELERKENLKGAGAIPQSELDDARLAADTAVIELRRQEFYLAAFKAILVIVELGPQAVEKYLAREDLETDVYQERLRQAEARLARAERDLKLASLVSPIDGVVLERYEQGGATLEAGRALLLLGNLETMEVIAETLTQDAMKLPPEATVEYEPAPGLPALSGRVKRVEPAAFTKRSSLGVEQQRVNVIASVDDPPPSLGVGFRLHARFYTAEKRNAIVAPRYSVLEDIDGGHFVFKIVDGELNKQPVRLGLQTDLELEIVEGLEADERIVATPTAKMSDGQKATIINGEK